MKTTILEAEEFRNRTDDAISVLTKLLDKLDTTKLPSAEEQLIDI